MKYFFLDTSLKNGIIGIIEDDQLIYYNHKFYEKDLAEHIFVMIDDAFSKVKFTPKEIDKIFVVTGPGSFTGIRIGVTIAKTMAWSFDIPIVPLSSLEVLATSIGENAFLAPIIDARRGYVYGALYNQNLDPIIPDTYILFDRLKEKIGHIDKCLYVTYDQYLMDQSRLPQIDLLRIIKKHQNDEGVNPHFVNPTYLKLTEAEENRNRQYDQECELY